MKNMYFLSESYITAICVAICFRNLKIIATKIFEGVIQYLYIYIYGEARLVGWVLFFLRMILIMKKLSKHEVDYIYIYTYEN